MEDKIFYNNIKIYIFNVDMGYVCFKKELLYDGNLDVMVGII